MKQSTKNLTTKITVNKVATASAPTVSLTGVPSDCKIGDGTADED